VEGQWPSTFRDKEAFIIIYDMSSLVEISRLVQWYERIVDEANCSKAVLLFLGNNQN